MMQSRVLRVKARIDMDSESSLIGLKIFSSEQEKRKYYLSLTPGERMQLLEHLRRLKFGDACDRKIEKVFEYSRAPSREHRLS